MASCVSAPNQGLRMSRLWKASPPCRSRAQQRLRPPNRLSSQELPTRRPVSATLAPIPTERPGKTARRFSRITCSAEASTGARGKICSVSPTSRVSSSRNRFHSSTFFFQARSIIRPLASRRQAGRLREEPAAELQPQHVLHMLCGGHLLNVESATHEDCCQRCIFPTGWARRWPRKLSFASSSAC